MKQKFSTSWLSSKQPRKQRKYLYNLTNHLKRKVMASGLSKELKVRFGVNAIEVRTNDIVRIMRGKFKKKEGKVVEINMKKKKIGIEGIQRSKTDGTKVNVLVHPSKVQIITFDEEDKKRFKNLNKKEIKDEKKPSSKKVADEKKEVKNLKENKEKENAHKKK